MENEAGPSVHSANKGPKPQDSKVARMILNDDEDLNINESKESRLARVKAENEEKIRKLQDIICTQRVFNRWVFLGRDAADPESLVCATGGQECYHSKCLPCYVIELPHLGIHL